MTALLSPASPDDKAEESRAGDGRTGAGAAKDEVTEAEWMLALVFLVPSHLLLRLIPRYWWSVSLAWIGWLVGTSLVVWGWTRLVRTRGRGASGWFMFLGAHAAAVLTLLLLVNGH